MNYRTIAIVLLLLLIGVAAAGGAYLMQPVTPDPATASRQAIFRYLVVGDLSSESREYQVAMVDRVMTELAEAPLSASASDQIPAAYLDQANANLTTLKRVWFESRGVRYHEIAESEQHDYLDEQIEAVLDWSRVDLQIGSSGDQEDVRASYAAEFFAQIETWISEAGPEQAELLSLTVREGIIRWLATRSLEQEPLGTRQELAERIVAELDRGLRLDEVLQSLPADEQKLLADNSLLLIEAWLHTLAAEYEQLPAEERPAYMQAQLDRVQNWNLASLMLSSPSGSGSTGSPLTGMQAGFRMLAIINGWVARADEESRPRFQAFMLDLQKLWLARQMNR